MYSLKNFGGTDFLVSERALRPFKAARFSSRGITSVYFNLASDTKSLVKQAAYATTDLADSDMFWTYDGTGSAASITARSVHGLPLATGATSGDRTVFGPRALGSGLAVTNPFIIAGTGVTSSLLVTGSDAQTPSGRMSYLGIRLRTDTSIAAMALTLGLVEAALQSTLAGLLANSPFYSDQTEGALFNYNSASGGNVRCVTTLGGTDEVKETSVPLTALPSTLVDEKAVTASTFLFEFVVMPNRTVRYFINGSEVHRSTTALKASAHWMPFIGIRTTAAGAKTVHLIGLGAFRTL